VKKYHYNYRTEEEMSEENMKKTFVNLCTHAFFHNKDKTVRPEKINFDAMNSKEKNEVMFKLRKQIEDLGELADEKESFFSKIPKVPSPVQAQFSIWKRNLFIPLSDQLEEQAKRKIQEKEKLKEEEKEKESIWGEERQSLHDVEKLKERTEERQKILKAHIAKERKEQGHEVNEEILHKEATSQAERMRDTTDQMPVKQKKRWRLW